MSQVTLKVPLNLRKKVGKDNISIDAENIEDVLIRLEREIGQKLNENGYIFLLNGYVVNDRKKLKQTKLSSGDVLYIFSPVVGG